MHPREGRSSAPSSGMQTARVMRAGQVLEAWYAGHQPLRNV
jgi:hypothetical protein